MAKSRPKLISHYLRISLIALTVFVFDFWSKRHVLAMFEDQGSRRIEVWDPFLNLVLAMNEGINFGLFQQGESGRWILIGVALAIVGAVLFWARDRFDRVGILGAGVLVGGALGNVWDRLQFGAVVDFLNMSCCGVYNPFSFNVADAAIFVGVVLLAVFPGPPSPHDRA